MIASLFVFAWEEESLGFSEQMQLDQCNIIFKLIHQIKLKKNLKHFRNV